MRKTISILIFCLASLIMFSCTDVFQKETIIDGPYYVADNPGANFKTLYFELDDGNGIGRVDNVISVGYTKKIIVAKVAKGFYFIDRQKDNEFLNGNEIIGDLKSLDYFLKWSKSNKDFKIQYSAKQ